MSSPVTSKNNLIKLGKTVNTCCRNFGILGEKPYRYSYVYGASKDSLVNWTIGQTLDIGAEKFGGKIAYIFRQQNCKKTFQEVNNDVDKLAAGFFAIGLKPRNYVGIWSFNCYEWIVTQQAVAKCGMILVHFNPVFQIREVKMLCAILPTLPKSQKGAVKEPSLPTLAHIIMLSEKDFPGTWKYREVFERGTTENTKEVEDLKFKIQSDSLSNILFTSGTTGIPKAAALTHFNIVNNVNFTAKKLNLFRDESRACMLPPLFHGFGFCASLGPFTAGFTCVFPSKILSPALSAQAIHEEKCTSIFGTPVMLMDIFNLPDFDKYDFSTLSYLFCGGAAIPVPTAELFSRKINIPVIIGYGATELTCACACSRMSDPWDVQMRKSRVLDHIELKIVDTAGNIVHRGKPGEILVRGYCVIREYWGEPEATRKCITQDGWYKTGDIGTMDEDGFIEIVSRIKEMINRGGENVYPKEIEEFLKLNPKIQDIQVVGAPDPRLGEVVCAWIILKPNVTMTEDEVKKNCQGQIADFKIPQYVIFTDKFPTSAVGKVLKTKLKDETVKKLRLRK